MSKRPWVLGISCSHNGSACLLHGDEIVAAVQDERLLRRKRQVTFPRYADYCVGYCLDAAGIDAAALDLVVYSILRGGNRLPHEDIFLNERLRVGRHGTPVTTVGHHYAHAVSAFATSGFRDAAVLVIDGSGATLDSLPPAERAAVADGSATGNHIEWMSCYEATDTSVRPVLKQVSPVHEYGPAAMAQYGSLGEMYAAVGWHLFGSLLDGPGKVMGLAPYGRPTVPTAAWLAVDDNGIIRFNPEGFHEARRVRWPDDFSGCADVAASVQHALEEALMEIVRQVRCRSASDNLCYCGGVALNSVANERIVREGGFANVFIFPAAEDSGVAVGAAYHGLWQLTGANSRRRICRDAMGRSYGDEEVDRAIARTPAVTVARCDDPAAEVARLLCDGRIVGWFSGGSELGPRSLGQRTILCDPRREDGKDVLNARVKHREAFRPFAPVVQREHVEAWFDVPRCFGDSPFMLRVWPFRPGKAALVPAVAHVDGTARVQTITRDSHPLLYGVVEAFRERTGVPMLLNTSFNIAGEPIVETPDDALWCLLCTGVDCCVFGDRIVHKASTYTGILDLRPRVRAATIGVELPVVDGRLMPFAAAETAPPEAPAKVPLMVLHPDAARPWRDASSDHPALKRPVTYASVRGRWGGVTAVLNDDCMRLLTMIDGRTDGHALLGAQPSWGAGWLVDTLAVLCRAAVIDFSWTPPEAPKTLADDRLARDSMIAV